MDYREAYGLPPAHTSASAGHHDEFAALAAFLAARGTGRGAAAARERMLQVLGLDTEADRIRAAFSERASRQRAAGDVKGAAATQAALRLVRDVTRPD